jgi:hypothetical protein
MVESMRNPSLASKDERSYLSPDYEHEVSAENLRLADKETQISVMKTWFFKHYEDPAEHTPYESREGGYIYIWGGPYESIEELEAEFGNLVPKEIITELSEELDNISAKWSGKPRQEDFDDYLIAAIANLSEYLSNFQNIIIDIDKLLEMQVHCSVSTCFHRLLYVNVITAMETYLSDAFIKTVMNDDHLLRRFIETTPEFQKEKIPLSDIFRTMEGIKGEAQYYLANIVWHRLEKVKKLYNSTLEIEFPQDLKKLFSAVVLRHDIVHRNGKTKDGKDLLIISSDVRDLIKTVEVFVLHIDEQLQKARKLMME